MTESHDEHAHNLESQPDMPNMPTSDDDRVVAYATQSGDDSERVIPGTDTVLSTQRNPPAIDPAASAEDEHPAGDAETTQPPGALQSGETAPRADGTPLEGRETAAAEPHVEAPPAALATASAPTIAPPPAFEISGDMAAENARLREENARLQHELGKAHASAPRGQPRRVRRISVGILVVLTCIGMLLSSLALWVNQEFLNTDNWVELVGPLAHDPQVVDAVSAYAADEVVSALNVQQRAREALPPRAEFLAVPLTTVVHDYTQKSVAKLMHTPQFEQIWITTNRQVHAQVLAALRGQTKNVIIENGTVTLNLIPILNQALQMLQQSLSGLIPANVHFPDVSQLQIPSQARAKLGQALGIQLPSNFGVITLFSSEQLAKAQQVLRLFDLLIVLLPIITVLLLAAAIWLSVDRRRTLIQLGIGIAITFLLARIVIGYLAGRALDSIASPTGRSIADEVIPAAVNGLLTLTVLLLVAGVVTTLIAYLVGKPEWFAAAYAQARVGYANLRAGYRRVRAEMTRRRTQSSIR
jgi:hypothetical protein